MEIQLPLLARLSGFATYNRFWKWGALLLALTIAFNRLARVIFQIFILQLQRKAGELSSSSTPLLSGDDDDDFFTSDDEDGESVCSSEDEGGTEMLDDDDPASISCEDLAGFYGRFMVKGSGNSEDRKRRFKMRRKRSLGGSAAFSLADLVGGGSVVKVWDGLGLQLGVSSVSVLDLERSVKIGSLSGKNPAVSASGLVFTASEGSDGKVGLRSWDLRRRSPATEVEWFVPAGKGVRLRPSRGGGDEKVCVSDDVTGKGRVVWDLRNARSPLEDDVTGSDGEAEEG